MPKNVYIYDPDVPVPYNVQHVEIPEGVTVIGRFDFIDCSDLQSITIPDSVTKIGDGAFQNCSGLQSITIPDSVTKIGYSAFEGCSRLRSITIPDSVKEIGEAAFDGCTDLQLITIPDSVTKIGAYTFAGCSELQSVTIPDSVTEIGNNAFYGCSGLQSVTIPDSVTEIKALTFFGCSGLQSITIPDSITMIDSGAFACSGLRSITIPDSITKISNIFHGCSDLQSITIPDGVTEIDYSAFAECSGLRSITIPDSVRKIGSKAFNGCNSLQTITIPDGVTEIGEFAFAFCTGLQSVTIPDSVTRIGSNAFWYCSDLRSVTIPGSVAKIRDYTFYGCEKLKSVRISDGVMQIETNTFWGCSNLQSVTIPDSVTEIGRSAFYRCSSLRSITIPDNVTEIRYSTFEDCTGLQSITIPDSITKIDNRAFENCPGLQSLVYKGVNIAPFIYINGYGVNTFDVIRELIDHQIQPNENTVRRGIDMAHRDRLGQWVREYPIFGDMRLSPAAKSVDGEIEECLRQYFAVQRRTKGRVPEILDKLAVTACICGIPPERLAVIFDVEYTKNLIRDGIPLVPAEACRCYYDRSVCDALIKKDRISVMAEAISLYNKSEHQECYRHLMDFILSHPDTKIEDLQYAVDHAEEIPMKAGTTLIQVRQHRTYMKSLAEVKRIEAEYNDVIPGFKLSDYPCNIEPVGITYDGMTARALDLSDDRDIALAARLGELTNCCQRLDAAGETAMMHGFLNPDAGFWVIEDKDGNIKAQAEIWKTKNGDLVFDNIEFANTDDSHTADRAEQLRGVIATWAIKSGYTNIIMGCGFSELGTTAMERAPIPGLCLTPEEVFALQKGNDAGVSFKNIGAVRRYMQSEKYRPGDFVYTDAGKQCVYIKKDGAVSDYLMQGYDRSLADKCTPPGYETIKKQSDAINCL